MNFTKISFSYQCFIALALGIIFGSFAPLTWVDALLPLGTVFLQLLKMIVIPIVFVLVVTCFTKLGSLANIKALSGKTFFWFIITALIAASIGLFSVILINPAQGFQHGALEAGAAALQQPPVLGQMLLGLLPANLFDQAAHGKVAPIVIFAVVFAIALSVCGKEAVVVKDFFEGLAKVLLKITHWIIRLAPLGIFAFIASVIAHFGLASLLPFGKFILTVCFACMLQLCVYAVLLLVVGGINPLSFASKAWPMLVTAFTTSSSLATLPLTLEVLTQRMGVPEKVASFVAPLGANAKMDACGAIYPVIVCVFTATLFHIPLDWHQYLLLIIMATIATIGTAGVPSSAIVTAMVVLSGMNLPLTGLALVIGIDRILDMLRTTINVTGTAVCSVLVATQYVQPTPQPEQE